MAANEDDPPGIEVDSDATKYDDDSGIGSDAESSTMSMRESVYQYIEENGRRYHAFNAGKYSMPNDTAEQERLDLQHQLFLLSMEGQLHLAPIKNGLHNVLDMGTGTGLWAIDFATEYPSANVIGTDLSPIQKPYVPPNCSFEVSDVEESWTYSKEFDYIHGRALVACFRDPSTVVRSAFEALAPGGYFEVQEFIMPLGCIDSTMDGTALQQWNANMCQAADVLGRPLTNGKNYARYLHEAGFVDVVEKHQYWPLNPWARGKKEKVLGMWTQQDMLDGLDGVSTALFVRGLNWTKEQVDVFLERVRKDVKNTDIHAYVDL
ncbi:methyltransferase domain-containing protein [Phlyctema vagabunda]|uniref:Methyltransferase domain-containing protein n=1 Tax=Phlyctema vagabunda TaxID=108571 RepID=A0ABR4PQ11_9HELO